MASQFNKSNLIIDEESMKDRLIRSPMEENEEEQIMADDDDEGVDSFSDEIDAPGGPMMDCIAGQSDEFEHQLIDEEQASGNLSDIKRFCGVCEMSFYSMRQLSDHLRDLHGIDKPFQCEICKARFPYSSSLYNHSRIHSEKKPFKCDQCDAAFRWKNSLKHHKRFIHKVVDPAEMEKLNETTFTGALRTMDRSKKTMNSSQKQSPRNKKPCSKVVVGVSLPNQTSHQLVAPLKLVVTSSGSTTKGSAIRSLFPQIQQKMSSPVLDTVESVIHSSMIYPKKNGTNGNEINLKSNSQPSETVTIDDEEEAEEFPKHTCGHCGRKFDLWQSLAKHLVDCEKILAEVRSATNKKLVITNVGRTQKESFFDNFTKAAANNLQKMISDEIASTSNVAQNVDNSKDDDDDDDDAPPKVSENHAKFMMTPTGDIICANGKCETSKRLLRRIEILERKYVELERRSNEKIAKLEATVADLYAVTASGAGGGGDQCPS